MACHPFRYGHADDQCFLRDFSSTGNALSIKIKGAQLGTIHYLHFSYSSQVQSKFFNSLLTQSHFFLIGVLFAFVSIPSF